MTWLWIWLGIGAYITIAIIVYALFYKFGGDAFDREELMKLSLFWAIILPLFLLFGISMAFEWLYKKIEEEIDKNDKRRSN